MINKKNVVDWKPMNSVTCHAVAEVHIVCRVDPDRDARRPAAARAAWRSRGIQQKVAITLRPAQIPSAKGQPVRTAIGWATPDASAAKPVSTAEYAPVSSGTCCGKSRFTMAGAITLQTATAAPRMAVPTHRLPDQPGNERSTVPKIKHQQRVEHRTFGADPPGQQVDQRRHGRERQQRHRSEQTEATGVQTGVAADELEDRPDGRDRRAKVGGDDEHGDHRQHDRRARSDRCGGIGEALGVRGDSFRPVTKAHSAISR